MAKLVVNYEAAAARLKEILDLEEQLADEKNKVKKILTPFVLKQPEHSAQLAGMTLSVTLQQKYKYSPKVAKLEKRVEQLEEELKELSQPLQEEIEGVEEMITKLRAYEESSGDAIPDGDPVPKFTGRRITSK